MRFPNKETVERIRREYPAGARVELVRMEDVQAPPVGTKGTVLGVDDTGSLLMRWDTGSGLNVVYGEDTAAVSYAESYQHIAEGYYSENAMPATTEQAVIMLASHFYESRDGSTGGFFADNTNAAQQVWNTVNLLLRLDRDWKV